MKVLDSYFKKLLHCLLLRSQPTAYLSFQNSESGFGHTMDDRCKTLPKLALPALWSVVDISTKICVSRKKYHVIHIRREIHILAV